MEAPDATTNQDERFLHVDCIKPFENIALAFSGGGFRATSYALGVLSYLNKLQYIGEDDPLKGKTLLQQVTFMSSASGGTIATTLYALYSAQGKEFKDFYVKLFESITGEALLTSALEILSDKKRWKMRPAKSRNLINAFSMAYDEYLFNGATIDALHYGPESGHLQEVCFNTTEFYTGLSFRQDRKMVPDADAENDKYFKFGNENIWLDQTVAGKFKLGDVLAASSCFPAGFEPIVFPEDFSYDGVTPEDLKKGVTLKPQTDDTDEKAFIATKQVGFMDGGITDNQGLQSMMYADGRRILNQTAFEPFDLMLVNDVGSYFMKPYINPPEPQKGGVSPGTVTLIATVILIAALGGIGIGIFCNTAWLALVGGVLFVITAVYLYAINALKGLIKGQAESSNNFKGSFSQQIVRLLIHFLTKTPIVVLKQMLQARIDSVLMLNMNIFMKRIRQLLYNKFYDSTEWKNRGKSNHIYDLAISSDYYREHHYQDGPLKPGPVIQKVAQTAFNMATTLWFDKASTEQFFSEGCIIACGQFTTCYNLLVHVERLLAAKGPSPICEGVYRARLESLRLQLSAEYDHFQRDPFFMYNQYGADYQVKDFKRLTVDDIPEPHF